MKDKKLLIGLVIVDLAGAGVEVAASAVAEADLADVGLRGLVEDRLAEHERGVLLFEAPCNMDRYFYLRMHRIYHESISGIDGLLVPKIYNSHLVIYLHKPFKLLLEKVLLLEIHIDAFLHVGKLEHLVNIVIHAVINELHHKVIV